MTCWFRFADMRITTASFARSCRYLCWSADRRLPQAPAARDRGPTWCGSSIRFDFRYLLDGWADPPSAGDAGSHWASDPTRCEANSQTLPLGVGRLNAVRIPWSKLRVKYVLLWRITLPCEDTRVAGGIVGQTGERAGSGKMPGCNPRPTSAPAEPIARRCRPS